MNMTAFRVFAFTMTALSFATRPCGAQESQPAATMPSDQELHDALDTAIRELGTHRLNMGLDGLDAAAARDKAIGAIIGGLSAELRKRAVDDAAMARLPRDVVTLQNSVFPKLTGRVVRIGEAQQFKDIPDAIAAIKPGDLVLLAQGTFTLPDYRVQMKWVDIAMVGMGVNQTTVQVPNGGEIRNVSRLLIEGVRIDCMNTPLTDVRDGPGFMLRNCELMNYNSGAGGSNAVYSSGGLVWLEGCLFDGAKGRSGGRGSFGNALDIRGDAMVFARRSQFVDNDHLDAGSEFVMLDRCTALSARRASGMRPRTGRAWMRESDSVLDPAYRGPGMAGAFALTTDDVEFVDFVLDPSKPIDDDSKQLAQSLQLHRRLPYWIGLIHHEDSRIRNIAATRVRELTGEAVDLPKEQPREGESLAGAGAWLEIEREYARLMNWFDANREHLQWDEAAQRYRIAEPRPEQPK